MGRLIQKIDDSVVRYLAASEVVERPLSVVKELVENALDAGAKSIGIRVTLGGQSSIEVSDDGAGIAKDDLENAIERHYSSKTQCLEDVLNPAQRGFRGEALHSIRSVACLDITSRQAGAETAWKITADDSSVSDAIPAAGSIGTRVRVGALFKNIPVRRKLMNTARHDGNLISDYVRKMAALLPDVSFKLSKDNSKPLEFKATSDVDRLVSVYGPEFVDEATEVDLDIHVDSEIWHLAGHIRPQGPNKRASKSRKALMVNGFLVTEDIVLETAIKRAWASVFSISNREFECALKLTPLKPTSFANFNAHPRKTKVEYYQEARFLGSVSNTLQEFLSRHNPDMAVINAAPTDIDQKYDAQSDVHQPLGVAIGQYRSGYILAQTEGALIIVDQHAAHERIILERMLEGLDIAEVDIEFKQLREPILVSDDFAIQAEIMAQEEDLRKIGFQFRPEHHLTYVTCIPKLDGWTPSKEEVVSYFSEAAPEKNVTSLLRAVRDLSNRACKKAIKSGHSLTLKEMNDFLRMMEKTPASLVCNHGRPTTRKIQHEDLLSMFDR